VADTVSAQRRSEVVTSIVQPSEVVIVQLNQRWRVVAHDGTQWILERLHENDWRARSHCRTRYALERCVQAHAGDVDPGALAILNKLPGHIDWTQKPQRRKQPSTLR
jgi:hypothetical protein